MVGVRNEVVIVDALGAFAQVMAQANEVLQVNQNNNRNVGAYPFYRL